MDGQNTLTMDIWNEAMEECNLDPDFYAYRERSL